ncbi:MAG: hypothetical protein IJR99_07320 [Kiritimatiellae bacterium]|nr:hypothetical protein [Kiritimatiellia bacterium]
MKTRKANGFMSLVRGLALAALAGWTASLRAETPDRFVRYVEATGAQAVDVGVRGKYGTKMEAKLAWTDTGRDASFLDAREDAATESRVYFTHCSSSSAAITYGYGSYKWIQLWSNGKQNNYRWEMNRRYNVTVSFDVGRGAFQPEGEETAYDQVTNTVVINGLTLATSVSTNLVDTGVNFYLFACNEGGTANYFSSARCYSLKIWQNDANDVSQLVRDFRPCVKNGRAGLYDAVSDTIFYSFTGTELVAATDEPDLFLDSVIAHCDTYIDTGVIGRSGTRCKADFEWLYLGDTGGDDRCLIGSRASWGGDDRFMPIHSWDGILVGYGTYYRNTSFKYAARTRYCVESDLRVGSQTVIVNGATVYNGTLGTSINTGRNLYLFTNNRGGTSNTPSYIKLYSLQIWQTDTATGAESLVRDFRPCIKSGEVALYDAVSGSIFYPEQRDLYPGGFEPTDEQPDHFVEYIRSPGLTFLDTKVRARSGMRLAGDFQWTQLWRRLDETLRLEDYQGDSDSIRIERTYLGATGTSSPSRFYPIHENDKNYWSGYGSQGLYKDVYTTNYEEVVTTNITETVTTNITEGVEVVTTNITAVTVTTNTVEKVSSHRWPFVENQRYSFDISYQVGSQTVDMNGERIIDATSTAAVDAGRDLYLFACNHDDRPFYSTPARCYGLTIWQDGEMVRDFKPCVKDGYAYLYDAVSKQLFRPVPDIPAEGNTGNRLPQVLTGEEKPDVYVAYVESDKTLYLDTGVIGRSGTTAEFEMQWLSGGDDTFLGSRIDGGNTRYFMWHWASSSLSYGYVSFLYPKNGDPTVAGGRNQITDKVPGQLNYTYHVRSSLNAGSQVIEVNDETIVNRTDPQELNTGYPLYLFACNVGGNPGQYSSARLYWLKIWQDGYLVRNFRPVRLNNNQAALWDSRHNQIYVPSKPFSAIGPRGDKVVIEHGTVLFIR